MKLFRLLIIAVSFVIYTVPVYAVNIGYSLFSAIRQSDNLTQNAQQLSGTALISGGTFSFTSEGDGTWLTDISGSLSREWFSIDEVATQDRGRISASVNYLSPSSNFEFLLRDDASQVPRNRFALQDVGNLVNVNVLSARPTYFFQLSATDVLFTEFTYVDTSRNGPTNVQVGQQSVGSVNLNREIRYEKSLNESSEIALILSSIDTKFKSVTTGGDFLQENASLRWVGRGRFNQIQVEFGTANVINALDQEFNTNIYNMFYVRQLNPRSNLNISYRKGVNLILRRNFIDSTIIVDDQLGSFGGVRKVKSGNLAYTVDGELVSGAVQFFTTDFENPIGNNNERRNGGNISIAYSLNQYFSSAPQTNVTFNYRKNRNTIESVSNPDVINNITSYRLRFNYFATPAMSYYLSFLKRDSRSSSLTTQITNGDANSVSIGFNYAPVIN